MITISIELHARHLDSVWTISGVAIRAENNPNVQTERLSSEVHEEYRNPNVALDHAKQIALQKTNEKWGLVSEEKNVLGDHTIQGLQPYRDAKRLSGPQGPFALSEAGQGWLPGALVSTENGPLIRTKTIKGDRVHLSPTRDEADAEALRLAKAWIDTK